MGLLALLTAIGVALPGASAASAAQRVLGWGWHSGSAASPFDVPTPLSGVEGAVGGAAGGHHNLVVLAGGTVAGWGSNSYGALGANPAFDQLPVPLEGLSGVQAVAAGNYTSYALMEDGTVRAWGRGQEGQLGDGSTSVSQPTPVEVSGLEGVTAIAAGGYHALALLESGTVVQWGAWYRSGAGQSTPVAVPGLTNVKAIAVGEHAAYALLADGTVKAWGYNEEGALGIGAAGGGLTATPATVSGLTGVQAIAAGGNSAVALLEDGTVRDWGSNEDGKLGTGKYGRSAVPVLVEGVSEAQAVAMGADVTFALLQDGSLIGWGGGGGAVGAGDIAQHLTPVPVCGGKAVSAVFAGGSVGDQNEISQPSAFAIAAPGPLCPEFDSTKPGWGRSGTTLTLKGVNLDEVSSVLVGESAASFTVVSPTEIKAASPPGTGEVPITGIGPGGSFGSQSGARFDYVEAPSFGRCVRSYEAETTEEFSNDLCTATGGGKGWEWEPLANGALSSVAKKPIMLETAGVSVTCKSATGTGALRSNKTAGSLVWTLTGCERLGQPCSSSGAMSGSIVTEPLQGSLAIYKPGPKGDRVKDKSGLVISPVASGGPVAQFSCGATSVVVGGSVIGQLGTNKSKPALALKFAMKKGAQEPSGLPGGPSAVLSASVEGGPARATTLTGTMNLTIVKAGLIGVNTIAYD